VTTVKRDDTPKCSTAPKCLTRGSARRTLKVMDLNRRQREVLAGIVREYISTGEAVGSRTLVRRQGIDQSAATVRNVMADLEEAGLLSQPHTSAGRVPTASGLRFFVDRLMKLNQLSEAQKRDILTRYRLSNLELQQMLRQVSQLLSDFSKQCAVVLVPRSESAVLKRMEFVQISEDRVIAVLVMSSGLVQNRLLRPPSPLDPSEVERVHRYLNELCKGKTLREVRDVVARELENEEVRYDKHLSQALQMSAEVLDQPAEDELVIGGQERLLDHPNVDRDQIKELISGIEHKRLVLGLLDETMDGEGVQVFIGSETRESRLRDFTVIASAYGGQNPLGTLGVLGPSNMNYGRVIPFVDFAADLLTELLS
jgi:heat-inducible transcriptional repressor